MSTRRSMMREIGTAFAVLAIYLLTILAPLHQARASQMAFEELGYSAVQYGWVLCLSSSSSGDDSNTVISNCPAASAGKHDLALPALDAVAAYQSPAAIVVRRPAQNLALIHQSPVSLLGPRGPPVLV